VNRAPAVAGRFYPGDAKTLAADVARFLGDVSGARPAIGIVAPHAGYMYSGEIAGKTFARVDVPARAIVLAPNHTGRGAKIAVVAEGVFELPGGGVPIDAALAARVLAEVPGAAADARAHEREHAVEVELPFLRARRPDVQIVPIVLGGLSEEEAIAVGEGLARAAPDALVVASSDMNHYLADDVTRAIDRKAIDRLLALDARGLYRTVRDDGISMCGVLPATAMLACARARGAAKAELAGYATSGDAFGDRDRVVGYAGVIVM
jgi:AmmeMemoRadiSam system protein B